MTRCKAFWKKVRELLAADDKEGLREFCKKHRTSLWRVVDHVKYEDKFCDVLPIGNMAEGATRQLRKMERKEPELHAEVLELVCKGIKPKDAIKQVKETNRPKIKSRKDVILSDICDIELSDVDLILTDPPYPKEFLRLWGILFSKASEGLKEGGFLVTYTPHIYLPDIFIFAGLSGLNYVWTIAQIHTGPQAAYHPSKVNIGWKPITVFVKGKIPEIKYFSDVLQGHGREKDDHEWQQALGESEELIKMFSYEEALVVDPFVGSGTTAIAARNTGRSFLVFDNDPVAIQTTLERLENGSD